MSSDKILLAHTIGMEMLDYLEKKGCLEDLMRKTENQAVQLLEEIRGILNDPALDDPECFQRIEAIVEAFSRYGIDTTRHDWG